MLAAEACLRVLEHDSPPYDVMHAGAGRNMEGLILSLYTLI